MVNLCIIFCAFLLCLDKGKDGEKSAKEVVEQKKESVEKEEKKEEEQVLVSLSKVLKFAKFVRSYDVCTQKYMSCASISTFIESCSTNINVSALRH